MLWPPWWRLGADVWRVDAAGRAGSGLARFVGASPLVLAVADDTVSARAGSGWLVSARWASVPPSCVLFCPFYVLNLYMYLSSLFYVIHVFVFMTLCIIVLLCFVNK